MTGCFSNGAGGDGDVTFSGSDGYRIEDGGFGCGNRGIGYIVLSMFSIWLTPCIIGSPILIPGGGAVE